MHAMNSHSLTRHLICRFSVLLCAFLLAVRSAAPPTVESVAAGGRAARHRVHAHPHRRAARRAQKSCCSTRPASTCTKLDRRVRERGHGHAEGRGRLPARRAPVPAPHAGRGVRSCARSASRRSRSSPRRSRTTADEAASRSRSTSASPGVIESGGVDCFAVDAEEGPAARRPRSRRVRLGGELTDTVLTVFGPDGKRARHGRRHAAVPPGPVRLARRPGRRRVHGPGPRDELRRRRQPPLRPARRHFPRPAAVFPPGGPAGTRSRRQAPRRRGRRAHPDGQAAGDRRRGSSSTRPTATVRRPDAEPVPRLAVPERDRGRAERRARQATANAARLAGRVQRHHREGRRRGPLPVPGREGRRDRGRGVRLPDRLAARHGRRGARPRPASWSPPTTTTRRTTAGCGSPSRPTASTWSG